MHIIVEGIFLQSLEFKLIPENSVDLSYNLRIHCESHYPEDELLIQIITFDLAHGLEKPPFVFKFSFQSQFRCVGEGSPTLVEFAQGNGPAYVVPYARELISNITSRTGAIPTLVIPPINIFSLIEEGLHVSDEESLGLDDLLPAEDDAKAED